MKKAFTMIELVFVIVMLGILAAIAIPRLGASRDDAEIARALGQIASIRAGIENKRSANLLSGQKDNVATSKYPTSLDESGLFGVVLSPANPIGWSKGSGDDTYNLKVAKSTITFKYYPVAPNPNPDKIKAGSFRKESCTPADGAVCYSIN